MLNIIKNTTDPKSYENQSYNESGINYITFTDNKRYQFKERIFGHNLLSEFITTQTNIEKFCNRNNSEDKAIINIFNSLNNTMLITSKLIDILEPIYNLPSYVDNEKTIILDIDEALRENGFDLDPVVYLFYDDLFITDFESLLMHSYSLLDKIAIYMKEYKIYNNSQNEQLCFGQVLTPRNRTKNYYFSNLITHISQLNLINTNDNLISKINNDIQQLNPLKNIIIPGQHKTLRNKIVHQETILNLSSNIFAIYRYKNKFLKFDNFVEDINSQKKYPPMVECIDRILKNIIHFNLNILNTILNDKFSLNLKTNITSNIPWGNPMYNHGNDILESTSQLDKIKMNTFDINSKGFTLQDFYYVKKKFLNNPVCQICATKMFENATRV